MKSSGTVNQTTINVATVIDTAFRRCGKAPSTVSGELLEAAQNALQFMLAELATEGINLFCVRKSILPVVPRTHAYELPTGVLDVLNVYHRRVTSIVGVGLPSPVSLGIRTSGLVSPTLVSGTFGAPGTTRLAVEYNQGEGWQLLASSDELTSGGPGDTWAYDLPTAIVGSSQWRVRAIADVDGILQSARFGIAKNEHEVTQLNRDDYLSLPNKYTRGERALEYWFDKQLTPVLHVWPVPDNANDQIIVYQHGMIEDVGRLTNSLAIPSHWMEMVFNGLAARLCLEIPPSELPPGRYETVQGLYLQGMQRVGRKESDGSDFTFQPNFGGYTR